MAATYVTNLIRNYVMLLWIFPKLFPTILFSLPNTLFNSVFQNTFIIYFCFVSKHNFEFPLVSNLYIYPLFIIKLSLTSYPQNWCPFITAGDLVSYIFITSIKLCIIIRLFLNTRFKSARNNCHLAKTFHHFALLKYSCRVSAYSKHLYRKFRLDGNSKSLLRNSASDS
jgi:hypothetical protein